MKAHTKWCDGLIERLIGDLQAAHAELAEKERELERERAEKKAQAQAHAAAQAAHAHSGHRGARARRPPGCRARRMRSWRATRTARADEARLEAESELRRKPRRAPRTSSAASSRRTRSRASSRRSSRRSAGGGAERTAPRSRGLVHLSHLRGWMDEAAPLSPLMPRPMPSAASPDTEAHRRNPPRWAPRVAIRVPRAGCRRGVPPARRRARRAAAHLGRRVRRRCGRASAFRLRIPSNSLTNHVLPKPSTPSLTRSCSAWAPPALDGPPGCARARRAMWQASERRNSAADGRSNDELRR